MIDTVHNTHLVKAYELIDFIGNATDLESLVLMFGRAYGYIESLRDTRILPHAAFANMEKQARANFETINTRLAANARRPDLVAPSWKAKE
jgi:hypothetical protein